MERELGAPQAAGPTPDNERGVINRVKMYSKTEKCQAPKGAPDWCPEDFDRDLPYIQTLRASDEW